MPASEQIVDILAETHNQPSYQSSQQIDRVPLLKRLSNKYFELGACALFEEIASLTPAVLKKSDTTHPINFIQYLHFILHLFFRQNSWVCCPGCYNDRQIHWYHKCSNQPFTNNSNSYRFLCLMFQTRHLNSIWFPLQNKGQFELESLKGSCWQNSLIKALEWHPYSNKFAVAFKNDLVKVYSHSNQPVVLKHPKQTSVTCLAWK